MWGPNHKHKLNDCIETKVWLLQTPGYSSRTCTLQHSPDSSVYWRLGVGTNPCCSVAQSCLILWNSMDCSTLGFHVLRHLPEFAQTHVHWAGDDIQPSHLLPSPLALNLSKHQSLFQRVGSLHQVARVLKLQLQHQSFQWIFRAGFL